MLDEVKGRSAGESSEEPVRAQALIPYAYPVSGDEIDLVDVGVSLWRRWKLMLTVFLVCVVAAVLITFLVPRSYTYSATIEIGSRVVGTQIQPIESSDSAASKLHKGYLPQVVTRYSRAHGFDPRKYNFTVEAPTGSDLVVISGVGRLSEADHFMAIEKAAAQLLVASDARVIKSQQAQLMAQLAKAKSQLVQLENPANQKLLQSEAKALQQYRDQARQQQIASGRGGGGASDAMTQLLLSTQVQQAAQQLAAVQQQLNNLPSDIASQKAAVRSIQTQLDNIQLTRIVAGPLRSIEPVGLSRDVVIIIGVVIGIILALIVGGCVNYGAAVRRRLARAEGSSG